MKKITCNIGDLLQKRLEIFTRSDTYDATARQHICEAISEASEALCMHKGAYLIIDDFKITICYKTFTSEHFLF